MLLGVGRDGETGRETLVDDGDAVVVDVPVFHDVAFRTLADGDDMIGFFQRATEFPGIDLGIQPVVELRVAQEDEVVDGHDTADAALADTHGQFAGETMIDLDAVFLQILDDARAAPDGFVEGHGAVLRITELEVRSGGYLAAQVVAPLVWGIETQPQAGGEAGDVVDEGANPRADIALKKSREPQEDEPADSTKQENLIKNMV